MIWILYNILFPFAFALLLPYYLYRMFRRGGYWGSIEQRIGIYSEEIREKLAGLQGCIWIHAVSVGEIGVALKFMQEYRKKYPQSLFVLTTNTSTAHELARKKLAERDLLLYFPLDFPPIVKTVLNRINPSRLILIECEIWPNLIREAAKRAIPIAIINGRISKNSFRGYRKLRPLTRQVLAKVDTICARGEKDLEHFIALGASRERVHLCGSLKFDVAEADRHGRKRATQILKRAGISANAKILLGGSTWPAEEALLLDTYTKLKERIPELALVLVPRHFERAPEVVEILKSRELNFVQRSSIETNSKSAEILLVDSTGELMDFYASANVVFIGKSLAQNHGGQNPIEPALLGKPIIVGPNMENFPVVMSCFRKADAILQIEDGEQLLPSVEKLVQDSDFALSMGVRAANLVESQRGVMRKTVQLLSRES